MFQKKEKSTGRSVALKRTAFVVVFSLFFFSFGANKALAWDAIAAAIYKQAREEISYTIKGITMGSMKQAAIRMLSQQVDRFIAGTTANGARFITNWQDYLIGAPVRNAQRYANDYISRALSGRGSIAYKKYSNSVLGASTTAGEGFDNSGTVLGDETTDSANYAQGLQTMAQDEILNAEPYSYTYPGDPNEMFKGQGNLRQFNEFTGNGQNNKDNTVWNFYSVVSGEYQSALDSEKQVANAQGLANQGFVSETVNGLVEKPGILYKEMKSNIDNLPNLAMVNATNVSELAAAAASKAITSAITAGINGVSNMINRQVNQVTNRAIQQVNKQVNAYGPGALYGK